RFILSNFHLPYPVKAEAFRFIRSCNAHFAFLIGILAFITLLTKTVLRISENFRKCFRENSCQIAFRRHFGRRCRQASGLGTHSPKNSLAVILNRLSLSTNHSCRRGSQRRYQAGLEDTRCCPTRPVLSSPEK